MVARRRPAAVCRYVYCSLVARRRPLPSSTSTCATTSSCSTCCASFSLFTLYRVTLVPHAHIVITYALCIGIVPNGYRVTTAPHGSRCLTRCVVFGTTFYVHLTIFVCRARPHPLRLQWHRYPRWP